MPAAGGVSWMGYAQLDMSRKICWGGEEVEEELARNLQLERVVAGHHLWHKRVV